MRVVGRGVVTTVNGEPIATRERAEEVAALIREMMGDEATPEQLLLDTPLPGCAVLPPA